MSESQVRSDNVIAPLSPNAWLRYELIREILDDVPPGARLLEIGCGQGSLAVRLARRYDYTGVEQDEVSARTAWSRLEAAGVGHRLLVGQFSAVPLDPPYDVVCAFEVLEHIEDDRAALLDWSEQLTAGGVLVLSVPAWSHRFSSADEMAGHYRRYDPGQLELLLTETGHTRVSVRLYGFPLGYGLEAGRNHLARRRAQEEALEDRTLASGRLFQPSSLAGRVLGPATFPFRKLQRMTHRLGTGLVASALRPS